MEYIVDHNNFISLSLYSSFVRNRWRRGMGVAYNYHLGNFLSATASYSIYNRSYSNVGFGLSVNLGPVEIYCLTDNVLAFGTLNPRDNFLSDAASSINIDTKKVRNGQIHFGLNLTFGRDKKEKPIDEEDENRAKSDSEKSKEGSAANSGSSSESNTPKRTNYNSKGNSDKKQKSKKTKNSKSTYDTKTEKKKNTRKGELKTKVEQSAPKSSTLRKVSRKL